MLLLETLGLLTAWIARELRLLLLRRRREALRLSRKACELLLHQRSSKSRGLRPQSALEAAGLLERLLLLLAIARLSRSGAVRAP